MAIGAEQQRQRQKQQQEPQQHGGESLPSGMELGNPVSAMSVNNGSVTTGRSSELDRQGWSGSDYASSSSNDVEEYTGHIPPLLPAFPPSTTDTKRIGRRIAATISLVDSALNSSNAAPSSHGIGRSWPESESQRRVASTAEKTNSSVARQDGTNPLSSRSSRQARGPASYQQTSSGSPSSSATSLIQEVAEDSETEGTQTENPEHSVCGTDTLADTEMKHERLVQQYAKLRRKRTETWEIFGWLRNERVKLQDLRERRVSAGRAFMAAAQSILPENPGLVTLFNQMQDSQLFYDQAEQRLEELIDQLEDIQLGLGLEERRFYDEAARPDSVPSSPSESSTDDSASRLTLKGISGDRPEDIHPLFEELLETFKDLQLAKESLTDLQMKRKALERKLIPRDNIDFRQDLGGFERTRIFMARHCKLMPEEEIDFLYGYDDIEKRAMSEIESYSNKARDLRKICLERGLMPINTPFREEGFGFDPFFRDDIHLGSLPPRFDRNHPRTLAHSAFSVLLSNPVHLLEAFPQTPQQSLKMATSLPPTFPARQKFIDDAVREYSIYSLVRDANPEDKGDYINRWLLHKLRSSALEAEILYATFRVRLKIRDMGRWQQDVLKFWTLDQAANLPVAQFQGVSETPNSAFNNLTTGRPKPTRHFSDSGQLDFIGSWDVDLAWS
ncbi:hypothetical protein DL764_005566 [Monosporascus ibericus]|uniref:Uncharacterized protein n=1 Tax=Monosporascus ibericus TaxID=155417 RepID=A0A4Q4T8M4_9PEZI|nr:hypothetical protein DL764_005566 [Monosporascus ibericus]